MADTNTADATPPVPGLVPAGTSVTILSVDASHMPPRYLDAAHASVAVSFLQSDGSRTNRALKVGTDDALSQMFMHWLVEDPSHTVQPFADAPTLQKLKDGYCAQVDADAERCRLLFVTAGSAQSGVYLAKYEEALAIQGDPAPSNAAYPLLAASLGIDGETLEAVATTVRSIQDQWRQVAGWIEGIRLRAKRDIKLSATTAQVQKIKDGIVWPKP